MYLLVFQSMMSGKLAALRASEETKARDFVHKKARLVQYLPLPQEFAKIRDSLKP